MGYNYTPIGSANNFVASGTISSDLRSECSNLFNGNISQMTTSVAPIHGKTTHDNGGDVMGYAYQYDQLNRFKKQQIYSGYSQSTNSWSSGSYVQDYQVEVDFDANGNILDLERKGYNANFLGNGMDDMEYSYTTGTNQLFQVLETESGSNNGAFGDYENIGWGTPGAFTYDAEGKLIEDIDNGIDLIKWRADNKVKRIEMADGTKIIFRYDAMGMRVAKVVQPTTDETTWTTTFYVHDASGNMMATYDVSVAEVIVPGVTNPGDEYKFKLSEQYIYGSSRLGVEYRDLELGGKLFYIDNFDDHVIEEILAEEPITEHLLGTTVYELSDHRGNVMATVSDEKKPHFPYTGETVEYFEAVVLSNAEYYPYGMLMPGRHEAYEGSYRYGFQGQEKDDEIKGEGNSLNYKYRMHDPRLGRFFAVDPLTAKYPHYSPYQFSGNKLIHMIELEGLEEAPPKKMNGYTRQGDKPIEGEWIYSKEISSTTQIIYHDDQEGTTDYITTKEIQMGKLSYDGSFILDGPTVKATQKITTYLLDEGFGGINEYKIGEVYSHQIIYPDLRTFIALSSPVLAGVEMSSKFKVANSFAAGNYSLNGINYKLPTSRSISMFGSESTYYTSKIGKIAPPKLGIAAFGRTLGKVSVGLTLYSGFLDYQDYTNQKISGSRLAFRYTGYIGSFAAAGAVGGPWGIAAGVIVGTVFTGAEVIYDGAPILYHGILKGLSDTHNNTYKLAGFQMPSGLLGE